jgi:uncharacterized protein YdcH (DUF465 family)
MIANQAMEQVKAVYSKLQAAEAHITAMTARDDALVLRIAEAEAMIEKAYSTAALATDTQKAEELLSELAVSERRSREAKSRAVEAEKHAEGLDAKFKAFVAEGNGMQRRLRDAERRALAAEADLSTTKNNLLQLQSDYATSQARIRDLESSARSS